MKVTELIAALQVMPGDLDVLVMDTHCQELDDAAVDFARRIPPGVPIEGMRDWRWERDNFDVTEPPDERFTERVVVIY